MPKHQSSAGLIKQLLKKTKNEVKGIERAKEAAKHKAIKKIRDMKKATTSLSKTSIIPQVAMLAKDKIRRA